MMTTKTKLFFILAIVALLGIAFATYYNGNPAEPNLEEDNDVLVIDVDDVVFSWSFKAAQTNNLDGFPQTNVFLTVQRSGESDNEVLIDTVDGGCSQIEENEGEKVQCYYAGFGQEYRVRVGEEAYIVERKYFEEAMPDMIPENYEWETITEFPVRS